MLSTLLGVALLAVLIIDVADAEAGAVSLRPLKVVHEGPRKVRADVDTVKSRGGGHGLDVVVVVVVAKVILQEFLERQIVLSLDARAALSDVDLWIVVALAEPDQEIAEAGGAWAQPRRLGFRADAIAVLVEWGRLEVAKEILRCWLALLVLDVVSGVVVHAVEVVGAMDKCLLLRGESWQTISKLLAHGGRVVTVVDGVTKPADGEFNLAVSGLMVSGVGGVPGEGGVAVQNDSNLALVGSLELVPVHLDGTAVGHQQVVADNPRLSGAVADGALLTVGGAARGKLPHAVAEDGRAPGLIEGNPVLALGEGLEADASKVLKVKGELGTVEEATVALVKLIGNVPVGESDVRNDAGSEEIVAEFGVVVNASLVDGVLAATLGNDSRP